MAQRSIDILIKARDLASGVIGKTQTGFARLRSSVLSLRGALGGLAIGEAVRSSVNAFAEAEQAETKLATALGNLGLKSRDALESQKDFAAEMQRLTTVEDDQVVKLQALGASLGRLSGTDLQRATKAAIGFSRSLNIDVESAMVLVSKAAQGNFTAFSRYGIQLNEASSDQEKFNEVLRRGAEAFSLATAEAQTAGGQWQQLLNAIGDTAEQVGQRITEAFTGVNTGGRSLLQSMTQQLTFYNELLAQNAKLAEANARNGVSPRRSGPRDAGLFGNLGALINKTFVSPRQQAQFEEIQELENEAAVARRNRERQRRAQLERLRIPESRRRLNEQRLRETAGSLVERLPGIADAIIDFQRSLGDSLSETLRNTAESVRSSVNEAKLKKDIEDWRTRVFGPPEERVANRLENFFSFEKDFENDQKLFEQIIGTPQQRVQERLENIFGPIERTHQLSPRGVAAVESRFLTRAPGQGAEEKTAKATADTVVAIKDIKKVLTDGFAAIERAEPAQVAAIPP